MVAIDKAEMADILLGHWCPRSLHSVSILERCKQCHLCNTDRDECLAYTALKALIELKICDKDIGW